MVKMKNLSGMPFISGNIIAYSGISAYFESPYLIIHHHSYIPFLDNRRGRMIV